jgi:Na+/H+-dicarboxylate symporter
MPANSRKGKYITLGSIAALILGIAVGAASKVWEINFLLQLAPWFELAGKIWIVLLLLLIIPIAGSYIIHVFIAISSTKEIGKLGGISLIVHSINLLIGVAIGLGLGYVLISFFGKGIPIFEDTTYASEFLGGLENSKHGLLSNILLLISGLQKKLGVVVMIFVITAIVFALIVSGTKWKYKKKLELKTRKISEISFSWLEKFLFTLPLAVFCLLFVFSMKEGLYTAGVVGYLIVFLIVLLLVMLGLQYFMVACCGAVSVGHFFKSVLPSQMVAMSTRSSLATLPALLDAAEKRIGLSPAISGVIIPFFVTTFRVNYSISTTFALLFLAHAFQVDLEFSTVLVYVLAQLLLSFGSPGIPSGGHYLNLSLYLAAGIPVEGVLLMKAVDHIPDIFKTLLNVTEVMAVTTVVAKRGKIKLTKSEL